ncbi:hypothetical protein [Variovorax sp. PvP013]|uniref:hypothetical protein n=1 Tax=Variovorax sp. PvP013 TaxID=3156435 RepID=UPI003D1F58BA
MSIEDFKQYDSRKLNMSDGGKIVCFYYVPVNSVHKSGVDDGNRNVFRLDKHGRVMWQVTRIDYPETNWEFKHELARKQGLPGCIEPFMYFQLRFLDGRTNVENGMPPESMDWIPGCAVELANLGIGSQWFSLDVDTGVAVEITPKGLRPW